MLEASGRRVLVGGNIGVPLSAHVDRVDARHAARRRGQQLPARGDRHVPSVDRRAARTSRPTTSTATPTSAAYARAKARVFANQSRRRLGGRRTPTSRRRSNSPPAAAPAQLQLLGDASARPTACRVRDGVVWHRTSEGDVALVPLARHRAARPAHDVERRRRQRHQPPGGRLARRHDAARSPGFTGLEHVMEPVATVAGVRFVNDSKATNVDAAGALDRELRRGGGDRRRQVQGRPLRGSGRRRWRRTAARWWPSARPGRWCGPRSTATVPVEEAATWPTPCVGAFALARPDGVVLLAPACSSFDMFSDYAARGRAFKEEVAKLGAGG